jgi:hypothetical protein
MSAINISYLNPIQTPLSERLPVQLDAMYLKALLYIMSNKYMHLILKKDLITSMILV